jgi:hypothetical protein
MGWRRRGMDGGRRSHWVVVDSNFLIRQKAIIFNPNGNLYNDSKTPHSKLTEI